MLSFLAVSAAQLAQSILNLGSLPGESITSWTQVGASVIGLWLFGSLCVGALWALAARVLARSAS